MEISIYNKLNVILLTLLFFSCSKEKTTLDYALISAGKNKSELEKVLAHYDSPKDSLKRKAAVFLIENLPGKNSYVNNLLKEKPVFFKSVKRIWKDPMLSKKGKGEMFDSIFKESQMEYAISNLKVKQNIQNIKSDYIIENIELSFEAWENFPWSKNVSFNDFCNYVIPYRVFEEPVGDWRRTLMERYAWVLDSIKNPTSIREATILINKSFNKDMEYYSDLRPIPNALGFKELDSLKIGKCDHLVMMNIYALRAMGIPASAESAIWANHRAGHTWCAVQEGDNIPFVFDPLYPHNVSDSAYLKNRFNYIPENDITKMKAAKIHRNTYRNYVENIPCSLNRANVTSISSTIGINLLDVTSEYDIPLANLKLKLGPNPKDDILFLYVFNKDRWKKLVWAEADSNNTYSFKNLGTGIVYLPRFLNDTIPIPPFIFNKNGEVHYLRPNLGNRQTIRLRRKYFERAYVKDALAKMVGGVFQGANRVDFKDAVNLFEIRSVPKPRTNKYSLVSKDEYRCFRFILPDNQCRVAEMRFYRDSTSYNRVSNIRLTGKLLSSSFVKDGEPGKILDGKVLTYFVAKEKKGGWVGLDLGSSGMTNVKSVHFYPPSDGNSIETGDTYELFFWNEHGKWNSLGIKIANKEEIVFEDCPNNGLFVLKNHTKGSDVRIFTYENGQQKWW